MFILPENTPAGLAEARLRNQLEPLVELTQIKGQSECRYNAKTGMAWTNPPDELCDFENEGWARLGGTADGSETDGLLVRPKADGKVDGTCLFGNAAGFANGYEQLATLDANLDGHVSGKELAGLSVWQDKNSDGKADAGELQTVQQLGISDFNLKHTQFKSSFTIKGKSQAMYDWWPTMFELKKTKQPV